MSKKQQQQQPEPAAKQEPPAEYGLPPEKLNEFLLLEDRSDPDAETVAKITGLSVESLETYFGDHLVQPTDRIRGATRRTAYGIASGRIKRKEREKTDAS